MKFTAFKPAFCQVINANCQNTKRIRSKKCCKHIKKSQSFLTNKSNLLVTFVVIQMENKRFILAEPPKKVIPKFKWIALFFILHLHIAVSAQAFLNLPIEGKYGKDYIIVNYVDWKNGNEILDYQCGNKAYNGHQGTDFVIRSFAMMDSGVNVLAAADGIVTVIKDGIFDREKKSDTSKGLGNYIALRHYNGYYSYYGHLSSNSILVKPGDKVSAGQRMALVGSSGNSSDPHLHFELWWDSLFMVDPFKGGCGNMNSLWLETSPYDTTFNIWTSGLTNFIPDLDTLREEPAKKNHFSPADESITYWAILYGIRQGDKLTLNWFDPDETLTLTDSFKVITDSWYFYYWNNIQVPAVSKTGEWSARFYRNEMFMNEIKFTFAKTTAIPNLDPNLLVTIYPNPFNTYTTIRWKSKISGHASLEVFDALGRKVKTLIDEFRQQGNYTEYFDSEELPSGTYFNHLKVGNNVTTIKMIIMK